MESQKSIDRPTQQENNQSSRNEPVQSKRTNTDGSKYQSNFNQSYQEEYTYEKNSRNKNNNNRMLHNTNKGTLIGEYQENAYGLGVHSDGTGRAFEWRTSDGQKFTIEMVEPNGYGQGIGKDQYGRAVYAIPR